MAGETPNRPTERKLVKLKGDQDVCPTAERKIEQKSDK